MVRVAQVGAGGWGQNHARILSHLGALCAVCDSDNGRMEQLSRQYSVRGYGSVEELLDCEDFDAALVCTPTKTHADVATELLNRKKHVFVEKPLTYDSRDGERLRELAERNGVLLTCGYIERFNPAVATVKDFVSSKKYGELVMLEFHRESSMPRHIRDVGIIYDTAVHDIDTAMWLFDQTPNVVFASAGSIRHEHEDFSSIMLGFDDGKVAMLASNWLTPVKVRRFGAVCTEAVISSDFITQEIRVEGRDGVSAVEREPQEPLLLEMQNFIGAVRGDAELRVKPRHAINVTKVAESALLSARRGVPVYLDLK